jgi:hypothetical protein
MGFMGGTGGEEEEEEDDWRDYSKQMQCGGDGGRRNRKRE